MVIQTFTGTVCGKKHLTEEVILLTLQIPEEFSFVAGQFVTLTILSKGIRRLKSYSILNPPSQRGRLDLCIKLIEGGIASEVFRKTEVGDRFEVKGPLGHFILDETSLNAEHWFIAAGTGVTPFHSMLLEHLPQFPQKKFVLLFGVRVQKGLFLHKEFQELTKKFPHFEYHPTLSREVWEGKGGRVQLHLPTDLQNKTFYICGLKELVTETKELLLQGGVAAENIHWERYT